MELSVISDAAFTIVGVSLYGDPHQDLLRAAGWRSRGYLPHFDGRAVPQFLTFHLADSLPKKVIDKWKRELSGAESQLDRIRLQSRIERYLDLGYGSAFMKDQRIAAMVQNALLKFDGVRYKLFAWAVMPNHLHTLLTRFENYELCDIIHSLKSYTAHEANKILRRRGQFWIEDYFDRFMRSEKQFRKTVKYIENNPVKAGLCSTPEEWPFSSAWFRARE